MFVNDIELCIHLAAKINVHESLQDPELYFNVNVIGTQNLLDVALEHNTKIALVGTCMVYDLASSETGISEEHQLKPASPYAASKLAAEFMAESYYRGLGLPTVIIRPFNTYGPFQKSNMEGGVVSIFVRNNLEGSSLNPVNNRQNLSAQLRLR